MKRWLVAVGCSIGLAVGFGPIFVYSFGLFQKPMIAELGWTRAQFSLGFSLATLITALLNSYMGGWIDRVGVKPVALAGVLILPAVLVGFSLVHGYWVFLAVAAAMGLVGATTSYPTYIPALPPWFSTRLGLAFSIAAAGVGYGAAAISLLTGRFIHALGWRHAFDALAATVLAIGLLNVLLLIRDRPRERMSAGSRAEQTAGEKALFGQALRSNLFWRLTIAFSLIPLVGIGINFHFAALLTDRGFTPQQAAGVIAVSGIAILVARIGTGAVLDYVSPRLVGLILFGGQAGGVLILLSGAGGPAPYIVAALLGLASGGEGDLMPFVLSRRFGDSAYGKIYGTSFAFFNVGTLLGPLLMGEGFELFHAYAPVLVVLAVLSSIAAALVFLSAPPRSSPHPRVALESASA